jgi:Reverse transcriptase (RNA-dependent DNA polymerase)
MNMSVENILECSAIDIEVFNISITILCIYRPPNNSKENVESFFDLFEKIVSKVNLEKRFPIVCGDFNIDLLSIDDYKTKNFNDVMNITNLFPTIKDPTRTCDTTSTLIDNILISNFFPSQIHEKKIIDCSFSDHDAQIIKFKGTAESSNLYESKKRIFSDKNVNKFKQKLKSESWSEIYENQDVNVCFSNFHTKLKTYFNECFPLISVKNSKTKNNKHENFMTEGLKVSQKKVRILKKLQKMYPHIWSKEYTKKYKYIYFKLIRLAYKNRNTYIIKNATNKSEAMWKLVNKKYGKIKNKDPIQNLYINGNIINCPSKIVNSFSDYYVDCIHQLKREIPKTLFKLNNNMFNNPNSMFLNPITNVEINKIIKRLKNKKSSGFDEFPDFVIKKCADELDDVLSYIINKSFEQGIFPEILKTAVIKPLYKKGCKKIVNNYRPLNLLSVFSKIFERAYLFRLLSFLSQYKILDNFQHGFRKKKSTETAIFDLIDSILKSIDENDKTAGIFLDLSKAFDVVDHEILLSKLYAYGIRGNSFHWIKSFLKDRKQYVHISIIEKGKEINYISDEKIINHSVIQGSLLGPILFLLYINDLPLHIDDSVHPVGYADDSNFKVTGPNNTLLTTNIKDLISEVKNYFNQNGLKLNVDKTEIIQFQNIRNKNIRVQNIECQNDKITVAHHTKFLGIIIDENLRWCEHIDYISKKLSSTIFAIKELKYECQVECLLAMYFANFHCHIKYGIICWGNSIDAIRIFRLQKKVIRIICGAKYRAECRDLFKILTILTVPCVYIMECALKVKLNIDDFRSHEIKHKYNTRNNDGKIKNVYKRTEMYKKGPFCGCLTIYNGLPSYIRLQNDPVVFKSMLKTFLLNKQFYTVDEFLNDDTN